MSDYQRKRVIAAEDAIWSSSLNTVLDLDHVTSLVDEACRTYDLAELHVTEVAANRRLVLREGELLIPPWGARPLGIAHAVAHLLVNPIFPPHGAEFAELLLEVLHRLVSPGLAELLQQQFDTHHVHYEVTVRQRRTRRAAVYAANNERGVLVELLLADPPERVFGELQSVEGGNVTVGERIVELARGRYLNVVRA